MKGRQRCYGVLEVESFFDLKRGGHGRKSPLFWETRGAELFGAKEVEFLRREIARPAWSGVKRGDSLLGLFQHGGLCNNEARRKTENETRIREEKHKEEKTRFKAEEETRLKAEEETRLKAEE
ncbi:hypothetical protein TNCV_2384211 [Trichonephila clavipes]|nr:hypothetical protein TNCV_2384211 [Trichonephila clavipes]